MITKEISIIKERLVAGDVVGIPTETVYGLAANLFNSKAVNSIFATKQRPTSNPLIVHVASINQVRTLVKNIPKKAELLAKAFWPGPITFILPKNEIVGNLVTANQPFVGIRIPSHPLTLKLLNQLDFPIVAPSANPFNRISPTKAEHVESYFPSIYTLDGGPCLSGVESTIVGFAEDQVNLLRHGAISIESIESIVGKIANRTTVINEVICPGQNSKHYSPKCELILTQEPLFVLNAVKNKRVGILWFQKVDFCSIKVDVNKVLSPNSDLTEAASNLFSFLHEMDQLPLDLIIVERVPNYGLGVTINDRLNRAGNK